MKPLKRYGENKHHAAKKFSHKTQRTKQANVAPMPMRGGIRL